MSHLVGNPEDQFSCIAAHLISIINSKRSQSDTDFDRFDLCDGEVTCKLYVASELASVTLNNVNILDLSEAPEDIVLESTGDQDSDSDMDCLSMNDSTTLINIIYGSCVLENMANDEYSKNEQDSSSISAQCQSDDPGHDADNADSDDDNIPLSVTIITKIRGVFFNTCHLLIFSVDNQ